MPRIPIRKTRKTEIAAVGGDDIGFLYLEKRGYITVGEREVIDEWEIKRQQGLSVIDKLLRKVASDRGISRQEAQKLIFPQQVEGAEVIPESENIWLEYPEEAEQLSLTGLSGNKLKVVVATEFIKGRVAYPVELVSPAKINATELAIAPNDFYIKKGDGIKFGSCIVIATANHGIATQDTEFENISVEPISEDLAAESIGYKYCITSKKIVTGAEGWEYKDSLELDERLVEAIFDFYQNERSGWATPVGESEAETKTEKQTQNPTELIGDRSIGESNHTESKTPALVAGNAT